jgi:5-oxopent-3-ene-1,2,5-tricarboxylate decarboxylase/2-hydroxyhepta-2,4-diene-1,7-dioate isomerase
LAALGDAAHLPPHKAPPQAPVLQVKPRNTLAADGATVVVPAGVPALEVGASLGIVMARTACRVPLSDALAFVAGYTIVADVSVPVSGHYRPSVRLKARDGYCPLGPRVVPAAQVAAPDALTVTVRVDGAVVQQTTTGERLRNVAQLIADVTEFSTLNAGEVLMLGVAAGSPRVRAGQQVAISIEGLGTLNCQLVADTAGSAA